MIKCILLSSDIKPKYRNLDQYNLHLTHFNLKEEESNSLRIEFLDDSNKVHLLKDKGCIKLKKNRRFKKRVLGKKRGNRQ